MAPRDERSGGGLAAWVRRSWRALVAEVVATALLVGLGVASVLPVHGPGPAPLTHPAFAFGCVVVANAMAFGPVSGAYMNPAATLAGLGMRQLSPALAAAYVAAQAAGAVLGFGALQAMVPTQPGGGCTLPGPGVSSPAAVAMEAALTGALVLTLCSLWAAPEPDPTAPVKVGLVVAGLVYAGGEATGASLNPVRSLAPALIHNEWRQHWVYWVGPLLGSALAVLLYRLVLQPPTPRAAPAPAGPEDVPLHDKP